jgi:hypothetical protein
MAHKGGSEIHIKDKLLKNGPKIKNRVLLLMAAPQNGSRNWWRPPKTGPHIKGGPLILQWL